jgi:hypothetical protein
VEQRFWAHDDALGLVLSSIYGHDQSVGALNISFGVLSNVSYDVAPLGFPALNEAFEDVPALAKLGIDGVANFGTAVAMSAQAISGAIKPLTDRIPPSPSRWPLTGPQLWSAARVN